MDNIQETLLFPVRDAESRKQFLLACAVMLAGFIIPILPMLLLLGYSARIMRQIMVEHQKPSMPSWQSSDWTEMFLDGLRLWGAQLVLMLPLFLLMGCGITAMLGSTGITSLSIKGNDFYAMSGMLLLMVGIGIFGLFGILTLPYSIVVYAVLPHVAFKRSFPSAFEFKEWLTIFWKALGKFILGYAIVMAAAFLFIVLMQIAMMTIILICILPLLMVPYMTYQILIMNTVFAQAYTAGREQWEIG